MIQQHLPVNDSVIVNVVEDSNQLEHDLGRRDDGERAAHLGAHLIERRSSELHDHSMEIMVISAHSCEKRKTS